MKRSIRRHQQRVAKFRRIRILLGRDARTPNHWWAPKPWRPLGRLVMNEPGWWVHERVVVPARRETRRIEHRLERGADPDDFLWPDCRKPHDYYW
jgi:hypothetical protein